MQLGIVYGPLAAIPALIAAYFYSKYAIDTQRHAEIQRALAEGRVQTSRESATPESSASPGAEPAPV